MRVIIIGFILIGIAIVLIVPFFSINWFHEFIFVLKGGLPLFLLFIGIITILMGMADLRHIQKNK